ncbi:MAG: VWA domain-containing protein, partial [Anaerolineales bacterium]|nr:VWA domain-containing protein [Anaerolineales bacterium]
MLSGLWLASAESPVQAAASVRAASLGETDEAGACFSLDVVFIIDQSGSMDGSPGVLPNDPTEQRAYGPRWAIDWLTDNALDICPDAIHRVALISFGENAYLDLPLSNVDPNNSQEATRIRERLKENITPQDLGETNPTAAFKLAKDVLDDAAPIGESPRKRVIIYITDGHPCVRALGCTPPNSTMDFVEYARQMKLQVARDFPFDATLLQQESCLNEAIITYGVDFIPPEVSTQCLAEYRSEPESFKNSTYIWTILLKHGEAYSSRLRDQYVEMSESHAGEVVNLTANRGDIPDTFLKIMSRLAGVKAQRLSCGNFAVNPYLRQMRLVFFKVDADNVVSLSYVDAQNNTHQLENGIGDSGFVIAEHGQEGANERYVLDTPYPGIWHFDSDDCNGINAYYEPIEISVGGLQKPLELLAPDGNSYYLDASYGDPPQILVPKSVDPERISDSAKFNLQYTIRDTNGMTISQAGPVIFAINFDVQVTDPKGDQESYEMEWLPDLQLFQSTSILKLPYQGEYQVSVTGTSVNREFPYGPIESRQASQEIYNSTRELFTYSDKFMVTCPDLYTVDRYPWPEDVWQDDDGCDVLPIRNYGFKIT